MVVLTVLNGFVSCGCNMVTHCRQISSLNKQDTGFFPLIKSKGDPVLYACLYRLIYIPERSVFLMLFSWRLAGRSDVKEMLRVLYNQFIAIMFFAAHCLKSSKILQARQGEVHGSTRHSTSGPVNCSWVITSPVGERVILRYSEIHTCHFFKMFDIINLSNLMERCKRCFQNFKL